jgi:hypothetical protein
MNTKLKPQSRETQIPTDDDDFIPPIDGELPPLALLHSLYIDGDVWSVTVNDWRYGDHSGPLDVSFSTRAEAEAFIAQCRAAGVTTLKALHDIDSAMRVH